MSVIYQKGKIKMELLDEEMKNNSYLVSTKLNKNFQHNITIIRAKNDTEAIKIFNNIFGGV